MASPSTCLCGVCDSQHITANADYWCPECDEGLCSQYLKYHNASKATRNHGVLSVDNYKQLPPSVSNVSQYCSQHDRNFHGYCPQHENLCVFCPSMLPVLGYYRLRKSYRQQRKSVLFESLDQNLKDIKTNVERVIEDRKQNLDEIQKQRQKFHDEIKQVRNRINEHFKSLEQRILKDPYAAETKVKHR
ncbi:unnamed protein product [Mytilus coruscus]|uniref:B box-type domain-containing protein n=1 Tax=Mytilus coruscus TaxID=42192 RepID=A0A6J7ZUS7_MYTCO|nr:unnamed protein product [Mytilus coruscus]